MFDGALDALGHVLSLQVVLLLVVGTTLGSAAAILPGVSPVTMMALLLPLTFDMGKYEAFAFLAALMAAGGFAGSMTSILLNVPGDGINAATCLDGFPLARQGKAGVAIGASAAASGLGALFGVVILILSLPIIRNLVLAFSPPEFFAMSLAGIAMIATISARSPLKGLLAGLLGMTFGLVGINYALGGSRFSFGLLELRDGISVIPALIGLFALPELFDLLRTNQAVSQVGYTVKGGVWQGVLEVLKRPVLFFRSAALGTIIGVIPGVGANVASWVSYFAAVNSSKNPESFGKGNIEGVIAPEATIDAKEGASMMPVLALGLPAGISTAILLAAFQIHGVYPGQRLFQNDMALVWVMIFAMVFSNLSTSVLGLTFANAMVKLTLVPAIVLAPIILVIGAVGSYADQQAMFGILLMLFFGLLGLVMVRLGFPRPPLLIGMILLPLAEENFHVSLQMHRGSYDFLLRPITLTIILLTVLAILTPRAREYWVRRRKRRPAAAAAGVDVALTADDEREVVARPSLLDLLFPLAVLVYTLALVVQSVPYRPLARLFPIIVFVPLIALLVLLVARTLPAWHAARRSSRPAPVAVASEEPQRSVWWILAWVLALPLTMWVIGVIPAVGVYTAAFLLVFDPRLLGWRRAIWSVLAGVLMTIGTQYVFVEQLGMRFFPGIFAS